MDKIKVMALGGLDEEGKDLYVIEVNDDIFVINAGFKYPDKNTPGIDFIISDFSYLVENKHRVKAYILTKTKKNNFGGIPYIYKEVKAPIYCTNLTKIKLLEFSKQYMQACDYKFELVSLPGQIKIDNYIIDLFSTCCSMPETFGFSIRTNVGNIVYCGDFIVDYSNEKYFNLDLNTLGKIAEFPTLLLLSDSLNSTNPGYCSPNHRLYPILERYFKEAPGRIFIGLSTENYYHYNEVYKICASYNKKICIYDEEGKAIYNLRKYSQNDFFDPRNIVSLDDIMRVKENELVILISGEGEKLYEKLSILASGENEDKVIRIQEQDTFIMAYPPSDRNEVVATSTIDELYKSGCHVKYVTRKDLAKMHAYEEDLKMVLSLLKPKFYLPIQGYYVNLLSNAKLAFDMRIGLTHNNIFLFDNGFSFLYENGECKLDFNLDNKVKIGDVMIDGIGVGDVVNEIISERTRLSEDGVVVLSIGISKTSRDISFSPDVQMRGFLFLKDKEADLMNKEITKIFVDESTIWALETKDFDSSKVESQINKKILNFLLKTYNRNPVIRANIIVTE